MCSWPVLQFLSILFTVYKNTISRNRSEIVDRPIWVSIDEAADVDCQYVCDVIVGLLHEESYFKPYI